MSTAEIIAAAIALLSLAGGVIGKHILDGLKERIKVLEATNNAAVLLARIDACKEDLSKLHREFDEYVKEKSQFDYQFRHNELTPRLTQWEARLYELEPMVEQLWRHTFNGRKP